MTINLAPILVLSGTILAILTQISSFDNSLFSALTFIIFILASITLCIFYSKDSVSQGFLAGMLGPLSSLIILFAIALFKDEIAFYFIPLGIMIIIYSSVILIISWISSFFWKKAQTSEHK